MSAVHNYGRNDGRWIGMILPFDSQKDQLGGNSRGVRYRVAIMGVTPFAQGEIKDEDITFALVKMVGGTGGGGTFDTVKYSPGDAVTGYYLDDERQQPVIDGCFGRTRGIKYGSGRFDAKSGFVGKIVPLNLMGRQEFNEQDSPCTPKAKPSADKSTSRAQPFNTMNILGLKYETMPLNTYPLPSAAPFGQGNTSEVFGIAADIPNLLE